MGALSLGSGEAQELAELRRRAYGTSEGIADDPAALERLDELERSVRSTATLPGPLGIREESVPPLQSGPRTAPTPEGSSAHAGAAAGLRRSTGRTNRRHLLEIVVVAVVAAAIGATVSAAAVSAGSAQSAPPEPPPTVQSTPLPVVSLRSTLGPVTETVLPIDPARTQRGLLGAANWAQSAGFDPSTLQAYEKVGILTPWTAERWDGTKHCVLLQMNDGAIFSYMGCAPKGDLSSLAVVVTKVSEAHVATGLPDGAVLMFAEHGDEIELRVALP